MPLPVERVDPGGAGGGTTAGVHTRPEGAGASHALQLTAMASTPGRGSVVALTDQGLDTIEAAAPAHVESVRRHLIELLTPEQITALGDISDAVVARLSEVDRTGESTLLR